MLTKQKKLSKKEMKEDKLLNLSAQTVDFVNENKQKIVIWAVSLVVVVIVVLLYVRNVNDNNASAGVALSRVMNLYDNSQYQQAIDGVPAQNIKGLKSIVDEFGSTENGEIAKIYLANAYFMTGKLEEAYNSYNDYGGDIEFFEAASIAGQAGYFASKEEYEKAADLYRQASRISEENILNPEYMLKASINYIKAGDKEEAKNLLDIIKKDYTASPAYREADKYLAQVN